MYVFICYVNSLFKFTLVNTSEKHSNTVNTSNLAIDSPGSKPQGIIQFISYVIYDVYNSSNFD